MDIKPIFFGCSGVALTEEERIFFQQTNPLGFILFKRNCSDPGQLRALITSLRTCVGRKEAPVFVDQEGGRVARLKPPHWPELPPLRTIGLLYEKDPTLGTKAAQLHAGITARMLRVAGFTGNFTPVLDLYLEGRSEAIGDRAISGNPEVIAAVARIIAETHLENGILPVFKHMPGHGRVEVDPHFSLPIVKATLKELEQDFIPFKRLNDFPCGMNCHVLFTALDSENPVSLSQKTHQEAIRGLLGFQGVVFSDDLAMKALSGTPDQITQKALKAGADILLYCSGVLEEMKLIAQALPPIDEERFRRWTKAFDRIRSSDSILQTDDQKNLADLKELLKNNLASEGSSSKPLSSLAT